MIKIEVSQTSPTWILSSTFSFCRVHDNSRDTFGIKSQVRKRKWKIIIFSCLFLPVSCHVFPPEACIWSCVSGGHTGVVKIVCSLKRCQQREALKKDLSTNKNVPHFQPFCLYPSRTILPTQSSLPPPQFKFGSLRQAWNALPTQEFFTMKSSLCKQFCLIPLQLLTPINLNNDPKKLNQQWPNTLFKCHILFLWAIRILSFTCFNLKMEWKQTYHILLTATASTA